MCRSQKGATAESLEKHERNIYGEEIPIKDEIIKHNTERDDASFIIGIPKSRYDK